MKALDDPEMFKYKRPQPKRSLDSTLPLQSISAIAQTLLFNKFIQLFQIISSEHQSKGQFILSIMSGQNGYQIIVYRQGSPPTINLNITPSLNWQFSNSQNSYLIDLQNNSWLIQFSQSKDSAHCFAVLCACSTNNQNNIQTFPDFSNPERSLRLNDGVEFSGFVFDCKNFPSIRIEDNISTFDKTRTIIHNSKISNGFIQSLIGLSQQNSRAVFIPQKEQFLSTNEKDPRLPNKNCIVVLYVHRTNFHEEKKEEAFTKPEEQSIKKDEPTPLKEEYHPPQFDEVKEEKLSTIERMKKLGAISTGLNPRIEPEKKKVESTTEPSHILVSETPSDPNINPNRSKSFSESVSKFQQMTEQSQTTELHKSDADRIDRLEFNLNQKFDRLFNLFNGESHESEVVLKGVTQMSIQLKSVQKENQNLKNQIQDIKNLKTSTSNKDFDQLQRENEYLKRKLQQIERKLLDSENRNKQLLMNEKENQIAAIKRATSIIKVMMSNVFEDTNATFLTDENYSGEDVSNGLFNLLRKHSISAFEDINTNGLF